MLENPLGAEVMSPGVTARFAPSVSRFPGRRSRELQFDVIVLGGGPAGYVCAIRAPSSASPSAVVEKDKMGGVCVNIGCIPTKALLHSASSPTAVRKTPRTSASRSVEVKTDYGVAMKRSRKVADQNSKGVDFLMKKNKITVIQGHRRPAARPEGARSATRPTTAGKAW